MATVKGCFFPDDLYYHVEHNLWLRREEDGVLTAGMTSYSCSLAGEILAFTPRNIGKEVERNRSAATLESGKWVGPFKFPMNGVLEAVNEGAEARPDLINRDPYGDGWLVRIRPLDWDAEKGCLVTGEAAWKAIESKMTEEGFSGCA